MHEKSFSTSVASKFYLTIRSPGYQYLLGMLVNCIYLLIVISHPTSYRNIQLPQGDPVTYVVPARNFVQYGIFGYGTVPDYHRTIGYPFFLASLMMLFGTHWLMFAFVAQAALFALMYPLLSKISLILFNSTNKVVASSFLFLILCGTYIVMVPVIMTDTFFTIFFTLGLWLGLESIIRKSYKYLVFHIVCIGYAAQVRPLLFLYPVINCFILVYVSGKYKISGDIKVRLLIIASCISLLIICNMPSTRNYINHGFFKPSDILSANLINNLGRDILMSLGKVDEYATMRKSIGDITDIKERMRIQQELGMNIFVSYPLTALKEITHNAIGIMGRAHWPSIAGFWGYNFTDNIDSEQMPTKKLAILSYLELFFNLIYLVVYLFFISFLVRNFRSGDITLVLIMCLVIGYLLVPTFIIRGMGGRMRQPVEGLMIIMAACEFENRFLTRLWPIRPLAEGQSAKESRTLSELLTARGQSQ